jgi:hypothetical protein
MFLPDDPQIVERDDRWLPATVGTDRPPEAVRIARVHEGRPEMANCPQRFVQHTSCGSICLHRVECHVDHRIADQLRIVWKRAGDGHQRTTVCFYRIGQQPEHIGARHAVDDRVMHLRDDGPLVLGQSRHHPDFPQGLAMIEPLRQLATHECVEAVAIGSFG